MLLLQSTVIPRLGITICIIIRGKGFTLLLFFSFKCSTVEKEEQPTSPSNLKQKNRTKQTKNPQQNTTHLPQKKNPKPTSKHHHQKNPIVKTGFRYAYV